jgi:hypothetical protein
VNPPVHDLERLACVQIGKRSNGTAERRFLQRIFHKLLLDFTWRVNRNDGRRPQHLSGQLPGPGQQRVFHRSAPLLPTDSHLGHTDGAAWIGSAGTVLRRPRGVCCRVPSHPKRRL